MKAKEMTNMTTEQLQAQVSELKTQLFNLRFQLATGQLQNNAAVRACKKDIARIKTIQRDVELHGTEA